MKSVVVTVLFPGSPSGIDLELPYNVPIQCLISPLSRVLPLPEIPEGASGHEWSVVHVAEGGSGRVLPMTATLADARVLHGNILSLVRSTLQPDDQIDSLKPFKPLKAGDKFFVGRKEILEEFRGWLAQPSEIRVIAYSGHQRSGRTSLLHQLAWIAQEQGYHIAYIDAHNQIDNTLESFVETQALSQLIQDGMPLTELERGKAFVAVDNLPTLSVQTFQYLQDLSERKRWLIALTMPLGSVPFSDERFIYRRLNYLSSTDVEDFMRRCLPQTVPADLVPALAQQTFNITGGHPFLVQMFCNEFCLVTPSTRNLAPRSYLDKIAVVQSRLLEQNTVHEYVHHLCKCFEPEVVRVLVVFGEISSYGSSSVSSPTLLRELQRWSGLEPDALSLDRALTELCANAILVRESPEVYHSISALVFGVTKLHRREYLYQYVFRPRLVHTLEQYGEADLTLVPLPDEDTKQAIDRFYEESRGSGLQRTGWRLYVKAPKDPAKDDPVELLQRFCEIAGLGRLHIADAESPTPCKVARIDLSPKGTSLRMDKNLEVIFFDGATFEDKEKQYVIQCIKPNSMTLLIVQSSALASAVRQALETLRTTYCHDLAVLDVQQIREWLGNSDPDQAFWREILSQMHRVRFSPFVTTGPVPPSMFFGREQELLEICQKADYLSFSLIGGRRFGKTSMMYRLAEDRLPRAGYMVHYLDCTNIESAEQFIEEAYRRWYILGSVPASAEELVARITGNRKVIMLDEIGPLIQSDKAKGWPLFRCLRSIAQSRLCQFVLTGDIELISSSKYSTSENPFYNFAETKRLGPLLPNEVHELVTRPMREMQIEFADIEHVTQLVYDWTAGHPNVVQRLCCRLVRRMDELQRYKLTPELVIEIASDPEFQREDLLATYWERATNVERMISLVICERPETPWKPDDIKSCLKRRLELEVDHTTISRALHRLELLRRITAYSADGYRLVARSLAGVLPVLANDMLESLRESYLLQGDIVPEVDI